MGGTTQAEGAGYNLANLLGRGSSAAIEGRKMLPLEFILIRVHGNRTSVLTQRVRETFMFLLM